MFPTEGELTRIGDGHHFNRRRAALAVFSVAAFFPRRRSVAKLSVRVFAPAHAMSAREHGATVGEATGELKSARDPSDLDRDVRGSATRVAVTKPAARVSTPAED